MLKNVPCQVTGLMPPGKPFGDGACTATPAMYTFPASPDSGTTVAHRPLLNAVVAGLPFGEKVSNAAGTGTK